MHREFRESVVFQASLGSAVSLVRAEFLVFQESLGSVVSQVKVEFLESAVFRASRARAEFLVSLEYLGSAESQDLRVPTERKVFPV